jgi:hypothetical protein
MKFYKYEDEQLLSGENILNKDWELKIQECELYTFPFNGWYCFENDEIALAFFEVS